MMVAPIAHDAKEEELVGLARRHREALSARGLVATGTTNRASAEILLERIAMGGVATACA